MKTNRFIPSMRLKSLQSPWGGAGGGTGKGVKESWAERGDLQVGITALRSPGAARSCSTTFPGSAAPSSPVAPPWRLGPSAAAEAFFTLFLERSSGLPDSRS